MCQQRADKLAEHNIVLYAISAEACQVSPWGGRRLRPIVEATSSPAPVRSPQHVHLEREIDAKRVDDRTELLVRAHARDLLGHQLAEDGDHREATILQLLKLLLLEDGRVLGLESKESGNLARNLCVVLLVNGQLMRADERDDLEPARSRHGVDRRDAARDVIEVQAGAGGEERVRRGEQLKENQSRNETRRQIAGGAIE